MREGQRSCSRGPRPRGCWIFEESNATLIAVGAGTSHRGIGIAFGDVGTEMLHRARASVLVARETSSADAFPHSVVVGYDGSTGASAALSVARDLAERFDTRVRVVTAGDAALTPFDELAEVERERDDRSAVTALVAVSAGADLLIVGSRGLRGLSAIGSVSERVGHQGIVLCARRPANPRNHVRRLSARLVSDAARWVAASEPGVILSPRQ